MSSRRANHDPCDQKINVALELGTPIFTSQHF